MPNIFSMLYSNYINILKITIFDFFRTGNPAFDTIMSTIIISCFGVFINYIHKYQFDTNFTNISIDNIKFMFYKKNCVIIEGKKCLTTNGYGSSQVSSIYSDRFKAMWCYIIKNIEKNNTIYQIKEYHTNLQASSSGAEKRQNVDLFMVFQNKHFKIDDNIYVNSSTEEEEIRDEKEKLNTRTDKITIKIYSYVYSISELKEYVDKITNKYLSTIKNNRHNKKFIYRLEKVNFDNDNESKLDCWREDAFDSTRNFNNIFFDGKTQLLERIDFFLQNSKWYYDKGIPYTLGIGLHGPPGTGKTSFIKALANYTNRHIIEFSLKLIKTKGQLEQFFFENTYNDDNEKNSVTFDNKIIVFEDIDCIGDIILDRTKKIQKRSSSNKTSNSNCNNIKFSDVINTINEIKENNMTGPYPDINNNEQSITLDDILNLWDGIRETPGRILIISSNHYNKLDPALIRPGRIDITHELSNASHNTISELYFHLFKSHIEKPTLKKIKEYFYTPAELINIYVSHKNEKDFINRVIMNKKV
jgi:chaperone BCS1